MNKLKRWKQAIRIDALDARGDGNDDFASLSMTLAIRTARATIDDDVGGVHDGDDDGGQ